MEKKKGLSVFDILKQGTSFKQKPEKQIFERKEHPEEYKRKQKKSSKPIDPNKYKREDSESELEEEGIFYPEGIRDHHDEHVDEEIEDPLVKSRNQRRDRINKLLKQHKIKLEGEDIPFPVSNFSKMKKRYNIPDSLLANMMKSEYERPTPVQMQSVPILMKNRNLISIAPTGSGKTMAYMLPIYCQLREHKKGGCRAVIFAPTVELGDQIYKDFLFFNLGQENHLKVKYIHKLSNDLTSFQEQVQHIDVIISTPMKFIKLFEQCQDQLETIQYVIFDEADKYFELGFLDQVNEILEFLKTNTSIVYGWFSATINPVVEDILKNFLTDPIKVIIGGRNNVLASIEQKLVYAGSEYGKIVEMRNMIMNGGLDPPVLIFVQSKERAMELYDELKGENLKLDVIHADRSQEEREEIVLKFRLGKIWVLITTDLMARGIDFKGVNLVINYDFPTTIINYIHRVGRTGRANRKGKAITFFTDLDKPLLRSLGNTLKASGLEVPDWIFKLKKADSKYRKHVKQFPVKREHISSKIEKQADPEFKKELARMDKIWKKKMLKKRKKNPEDVEGEENDYVEVEQEEEDGGGWTTVDGDADEDGFVDV